MSMSRNIGAHDAEDMAASAAASAWWRVSHQTTSIQQSSAAE
jgi:hypothetical protein